MDELKDRVSNRRYRCVSVIVSIFLGVAVALCLYTVIQVLCVGYVNLGGRMMFRVVTGSMEPTIPVGALMMAKEADIETIEEDDIVCFRTQESQIWGEIVTHRVVGVYTNSSGAILLETKGDANSVSDNIFVDANNLIGKVVWYTGEDSVMADIFSLLTSKIGFLGCIIFPALFLSGLILRESMHSIQKELQELLALQQEASRNESPDPLGGITPEEYEEMYERIRAEIMEEIKYCAEIPKEQTEEDGAGTCRVGRPVPDTGTITE